MFFFPSIDLSSNGFRPHLLQTNSCTQTWPLSMPPACSTLLEKHGLSTGYHWLITFQLSGVENPFCECVMIQCGFRGAFAELSRSFRGSCSSLCLPDAISWQQHLFSSDNHWSCFGCASFQECGASSFVFAQNIFGWCCNVPDALQRPRRPATALTSCMTFATSLPPLPSVIDFGAPAFWLCFGFCGVFADLKLNIWIWKTKKTGHETTLSNRVKPNLCKNKWLTIFNYIYQTS